MLDNRLKKIAELVSGKGTAVDVGTDHAYLAAELITSGKCSRVIASDIKEGPLDSARHTVEKFGVQDKVELILSDGLEKVPLENVSDIIIAGMGGETIADIVSRIKDDNIRLIMQPMTKVELLRRKLYEMGYEVTEEHLVADGDKMYVIIVAENAGDWRQLTEFEALYGFFDNDELGNEYRKKEAQRLIKVSEALSGSGNVSGAQHFAALAYKMENGCDSVRINDIYSSLDTLYPFSLQDSWDNSGLLVENYGMECSKVVLSLDITRKVVNEASKKGAELIISHHPVIFEPLRTITRDSAVYELINNGIAAICMHTNLDISEGGTNGVILRELRKKYQLTGEPEPFEEIGGGRHYGWIIQLAEPICPEELAQGLKSVFSCEYVRMSRCSREISRIAFCSGSGGSMLGEALTKNCDALITGDVKHDVWVSANNSSVSLFDCGHFHTENIVLSELRRAIEERFPQLDIEIAEESIDPCKYV